MFWNECWESFWDCIVNEKGWDGFSDGELTVYTNN